jgi:hypothetical protein
MTTLRDEAVQYLALRRALGFKLVDTEQLLMQFVTHLEQTGATRITTDTAVTWARQSVRAKPLYWRRRLGVVRSFARHLHTLDPATEVPPAGLLRCFPNRQPPHLYSSDEIAALMHVAGVLFHTPLRVATYRTLIGLLAVTGVRIGEAVRLDREHIDLDAGVLSAGQPPTGIYDLDLPREWLVTAAPWLKAVSIFLRGVLPVAVGALHLDLPDPQSWQQTLSKQLEAAVASLDALTDASDTPHALPGTPAPHVQTIGRRGPVQRDGGLLRALRKHLTEVDPGYAGLTRVRVDNAYRWIHPRYLPHYYPPLPDISTGEGVSRQRPTTHGHAPQHTARKPADHRPRQRSSPQRCWPSSARRSATRMGAIVTQLDTQVLDWSPKRACPSINHAI